MLLLRVALGAMLAQEILLKPQVQENLPLSLATSAAVFLLCAGLLTPLAAVASLMTALWPLLRPAGAPETLRLCMILVALVVALLGPGGYSLDALLFGRRRIVLPPSNDPDDASGGPRR
jgi:hypothetical protein